jgi:hypothetical protein
LALTSNPQIISDLRLIMDFDHNLELMNIYRGVPFICKAKVLSIQDNLVEIETHDPALICLAKQKQTKVLGSDYFEPAAARVASVDLVSHTAILTNFSYQSTRLGERMIVRVEPKEQVLIAIETEGERNTVALVDLSLSGMGVQVAPSNYSAALKPGTTIQAVMRLPKDEIKLAGNILTAIKTGSAYRLSVRFLPNNPHRVTVFRYLIDRRGEIAIELNEEYTQAVRAAAEAS